MTKRKLTHSEAVQGSDLASGTSTDKYVKQYLTQHAKDLKQLEKFIAKLRTLDGFSGAWIDDTFYMGGNHPSKNYALTNDATDIKFTFRPGGDGTTAYKGSRA